MKNFFNKIIGSLYLKNPINIFLGHKIYKNDTGFIANFVGDYLIKKHSSLKRNNKINNSEDNNLNKLINNGFVLLDFTINDDIVKKIRSEFQEKIKNLDVPSDGRLEISSINNEKFYKDLPSVNLIINEEIKKILEDYYGAGFKVLNTHIYRTVKIDNSTNNIEAYGSTEFWHNDRSTTDSIKLFMLLNNIDNEMGPMHIITKQDTKKIISSGFNKYREGVSNGMIEENYDITQFVGKSGSLMLGDTNKCLHRGDILKTDTYRDMLVFYIGISRDKFEGIDPTVSIKEQYYGFKRLFD